MIQKHYALIVFACVLNLSLVTSSPADDEKTDDARNCIQTRTLKGTAVVDDQNVLFIRPGNSIYHNKLPSVCKGLSKTKQFSYSTTSGSLCNLDSIRVVDTQGRESKSCRLGYFYSITEDELRTLVEESRQPKVPDPDQTDKDDESGEAAQTNKESDEP